MTVDEIIALDDWVDRAATDAEKEQRFEKVKVKIFPEGLDKEEVKKRELLVDEAKAKRQDERVNKLLGTTAPSLPTPAPPIRPPWEGLISPSSKAYRRGSLHDGTLQENERMREASKGSPFDADLEPQPKIRPTRAPWRR